MEKFEYAIIGQGAAAFAAAIKADEAGIKTVMIGSNKTRGTLIGGTCVNVGCVPSKRLISASNFFDSVNSKRFEGVELSAKLLDFKKLVEGKDSLVEDVRSAKYKKVLSTLKNVRFVKGFASLKDKNMIEAGGGEIFADKILIATGARTSIPDVMGLENVEYLTNEEALSMKELPKSIVIIGGGPLGLEFSELFAHLGVDVTVIQRNDVILPGWEPEISRYLETYLKDEGVEISTGAMVKRVSRAKNGIKVVFEDKDGNKEKNAEKLLLATGRTPNTEKLNLDKVGVETDPRGFIKINGFMQTSVKSIFAAGDVTGNPLLETLAAAEGNKATVNAFSGKRSRIDPDSVPSAVFTFPEAARVGLTDKEANERGIKCSCSTVMLKDLAKAMIIKDARGLIKMVINAKTKRILGVEVLSENAADIIHEAVLAVKFKLTIDDIIDTVHVFPTLSEAVKLAALSFYHDIGSLSCCSE